MEIRYGVVSRFTLLFRVTKPEACTIKTHVKARHYGSDRV